MSTTTPAGGGEGKEPLKESRQQRRLELRSTNAAAHQRGGPLGAFDLSVLHPRALLTPVHPRRRTGQARYIVEAPHRSPRQVPLFPQQSRFHFRHR